GRDPDLVLTDGYDPVWQSLQNWDIPVLVLQPKDIYGVFRDIQVIGKVMNQEKVAARLVAELQERLNKVVERTARADSKPTVFYEIDATNPVIPWTGGPGSFVDILISLAGGRNIVETPGAWVQLSLEELFYADPDIVVLGDYPYVKPQQVGERGGIWPMLTAVQSGRVYAISDPSLTSRTGPRIIDGLEELARIIHPELFP
ncbi:MAG: ABC transporter substrate-binding protein, partial [Dehalococcoidia bacterium]